MEIWILVIVLLVIAIVLLVLSLYAKDDSMLSTKLDELATQQSQELYQLKTRIAELEKENQNFLRQQPILAPEDVGVFEEVSLEDVSDLTKDEVIHLYSQGYTMTEISNEVALSTAAIQKIIDDYIENR